jgi:hypothetical protein
VVQVTDCLDESQSVFTGSDRPFVEWQKAIMCCARFRQMGSQAIKRTEMVLDELREALIDTQERQFMPR